MLFKLKGLSPIERTFNSTRRLPKPVSLRIALLNIRFYFLNCHLHAPKNNYIRTVLINSSHIQILEIFHKFGVNPLIEKSSVSKRAWGTAKYA